MKKVRLDEAKGCVPNIKKLAMMISENPNSTTLSDLNMRSVTPKGTDIPAGFNFKSDSRTDVTTMQPIHKTTAIRAKGLLNSMTIFLEIQQHNSTATSQYNQEDGLYTKFALF